MFVDHVRIYAKAGDGGPGSASFRRESFVPRGGPDGGDGGDGGSVILRADPHTDSLVSLFYDPHLRAKDGGRGLGKKKYGKTSPAKVTAVPIGTLVYRLPPGITLSDRPPVDEDSDDSARTRPTPPLNTANLECIADLTAEGQEIVLSHGGVGGRGNVHFKSPRNRAPTRADAGTSGEEGYFFLELRQIADAGFVGYPNAGKSTLLSRLSAARPKIAPYPFTTLHPLVGVVEFPGYARITVADIPGLIEGAHRNVGLGHEFLRHIMRCRLLLYVVDMGGSEGRSPLEDMASLRRELSLYDAELEQRPWLVVANKMDLPDSDENLRLFRTRFPKMTILPISAETGGGIDALREVLRERLAAVPT